VTTAWDPTTFDPHDPAFLTNPYPTYKRFRDAAPLAVVKPYGNTWVFRHADVQQMLGDRDTFVKHAPGPRPTPLDPIAEMSAYLPDGLFGSDPPRHTELRALLEPLFSTAIASAPVVAATTADELLTARHGTSRFELMQDYALGLPSSTLFTIMGIPRNHWLLLLQWVTQIVRAHDITQTFATRVAGATSHMALQMYFAEWVLRCQETPQPGLVGELCAAIGGPEHLTAEEVQICCTDFVVAGYLSTTFLIGSGLQHLLENPEQAQLLRDQPALMDGAIAEILRMDAPAQLVERIAAVDTELGGTAIPAGTHLAAVLGSADRDETVFADPDRFDVKRDDAAQVGFGYGIHRCIGAPLVQLVAPVAMSKLLAIPELAVAGLVQWGSDPYLRGMTSFPLSVVWS